MKAKIMAQDNSRNLEKEINKFIEEKRLTKDNIQYVKFSITSDSESGIYFSILIIYEDGKE